MIVHCVSILQRLKMNLEKYSRLSVCVCVCVCLEIFIFDIPIEVKIILLRIDVVSFA